LEIAFCYELHVEIILHLKNV